MKMLTLAAAMFIVTGLILIIANASGSHSILDNPDATVGETRELGMSDYEYLFDDDSYILNGECRYFCGLILVD